MSSFFGIFSFFSFLGFAAFTFFSFFGLADFGFLSLLRGNMLIVVVVDDREVDDDRADQTDGFVEWPSE